LREDCLDHSADLLDKAKIEFLQEVLQSVRAPCATILSTVEILAQEEKNPAKRVLLKQVEQNAIDLIHYLSDISSCAPVALGGSPLLLQPFNLKRIASECIDSISMLAKNKNTSLSFRYDELLPEILMSDAFRIKRILLNLLSDSLERSNQASISLYVSLQDKISKIRYVKFEVYDSGGVIPEEKRAELFTEIKSNPLLKSLYQSAGLGLPAVKKMVDELDGEVYYACPSAGGSNFICVVPMRGSEAD
jgi:signal transduction histidine kinase